MLEDNREEPMRHDAVLCKAALFCLVLRCYAGAESISLYYANRTLLPAKTRVSINAIGEAVLLRLAERFAGSLG